MEVPLKLRWSLKSSEAFAAFAGELQRSICRPITADDEPEEQYYGHLNLISLIGGFRRIE
jgi:hypothetical protein